LNLSETILFLDCEHESGRFVSLMLDEGERNGLDCGCVDIAMKNVIMELVRVVMEVEGGGYGG
jgi:hypothetical protein